MIRQFLVVPFFLITVCAFAQEGERKGDNDDTVGNTRANSLAPAKKVEKRVEVRRREKASKGKTSYDAQQEFYQRVVAVAKERRKAEKIMKKPQYSNPMYFGHKHPPKKHSAKKMRYCKECGIRH
jgi:hypothetical protein